MTTDKSGKLGPFICLLGVALQNGYLCAADIRFIFTELDIETGETDKTGQLLPIGQPCANRSNCTYTCKGHPLGSYWAKTDTVLTVICLLRWPLFPFLLKSVFYVWLQLAIVIQKAELIAEFKKQTTKTVVSPYFKIFAQIKIITFYWLSVLSLRHAIISQKCLIASLLITFCLY